MTQMAKLVGVFGFHLTASYIKMDGLPEFTPQHDPSYVNLVEPGPGAFLGGVRRSTGCNRVRISPSKRGDCPVGRAAV